MNDKRPFGVTLLAILAGLAAVLDIYHTLQYLHILPFTLGPLQFYGFDPLGAILYGVTALIWVWAAANLWVQNPQALLFVAILAGWNVVLAVLSWLGASSLQAVLPALLINGLVLAYTLSQQKRLALGTV